MTGNKLSENCELFLKNIGIGVRKIDDPFLNESHRVCKVFQRTGITTDDEEQFFHQMMKEFKCNAPGCELKFENLLDFEIHYNSFHRYTCAECKKTKANARLLEIHIEETHDSFFKVSSDKKPMYQCYVSDCHLKFKNPEERKQHCSDVHKFSKLFKYDEAPQKKVKSNTKPETAMEVDEDKKNIEKLNEHEINFNKGLKVDLNKNQKLRTFTSQCKRKIDNNYNAAGNSSMSSTPTYGQLLTSKAKTTSPLMFIPRQVIQNSHKKSLTQKSNILENDDLMELNDALPLV
ncbi:uncharacterized protein LOC103568206 isoform X1 [Microplitis demolitor]|uniref:uncharacterized protein LOC103568206 isoform X1 n=2 Tax=Microplitis demolitor TaxID=69319 RepID=UPI0004CCCA01|nr:uncharacterized protein LOC103568206 isoform X1 [Microplitis demolitor]